MFLKLRFYFLIAFIIGFCYIAYAQKHNCFKKNGSFAEYLSKCDSTFYHSGFDSLKTYLDKKDTLNKSYYNLILAKYNAELFFYYKKNKLKQNIDTNQFKNDSFSLHLYYQLYKNNETTPVYTQKKSFINKYYNTKGYVYNVSNSLWTHQHLQIESYLDSLYQHISVQYPKEAYINMLYYFYYAMHNGRIFNFDKANKVYKYILNNTAITDPLSHQCMFQLGINYYYLYQVDSANIYLNKFLDQCNMYSPHKIDAITALSFQYVNQKDFKNARKVLQSGKKLAIENKDYRSLLGVYNKLIHAETEKKDINTATKLVMDAEKLINTFNYNRYEILTFKRYAYDVLFEQKKYIQLITELEDYTGYYDILLDSVQQGIPITNPENFYLINNNLYRLFSLLYQSYYYRQKDNTNIADLEASFEATKKMMVIHEFKKANISDTRSKLSYNNAYANSVSNVINAGYNLWEQKKDSTQLIAELITYTEQGKSEVFRSQLLDKKFKKMVGMPSNITEAEIFLKQVIDSLTYQLKTDKNITKVFNEKILLYQSKHDSLKKQIRTNYPQYYKLKYATPKYSFHNIQNKLDTNDALIIYHQANNVLFIFLVCKNSVHLDYRYIGKEFNELIDKHHQQISSVDLTSIEYKQYKDFGTTSKKLYKYLISPIKDIIAQKELTIVPDKQLNLVAFDVLIPDTFRLNQHVPKYAELPYLIKYHPINILYSLEQLNGTVKISANKIHTVAFAPSYGSSFKYKNLEGALSEVEYLKKTFKGKTYIKNKATKNAFMSLSGNYNIAHLALHTQIDNQEPLFSQLLFYDPKSPYEPLKIYEVLGKDFNFKMLFLGGCSTGSGKIFKGEGIVNLGRSFFYTGVHNIIMAQWPLADKSGYAITTGFYEGLKNGHDSKNALQKAKVNYLNTHDNIMCHPYYWSNLQCIGTPVMFIQNTRSWYKYFIGGLATSIILGLVLIYFRKSIFIK